jgi:signal transduction histidine kinase/ligand-binding sensor domain-containing protein
MIIINLKNSLIPFRTNKKYLLFFLLAIGLFSSCNNRKNIEDIPQQIYSEPKVVPLNIKNGYKVNQLTGDSIQVKIDGNGEPVKTGVPFEVKGNIINMDSMTPPIINKAVKPVPVIYPSNVKAIPEKLTTVPFDSSMLKILDCTKVHSNFVLIDNYGDTIPTGKPILIKGTKVLVKTPIDLKALPPGSKDGTIYNFNYLNIENGLPSSNINTSIMDHDDRLWIGTLGAGISSYDGQSFRHYTAKEGFKCKFINNMMEDKNGNIWIAAGEGLYKYDGKYFTTYIEYFNGMNAIVEDKQGFIWVGFWSGIIKIDPQEDRDGKLSITYYTVNEGLSFNGVTSAYADRTGNLWFGTWSGGVNKFDGHSFTQFTTDQGISSNDVKAIFEDKAGNYWFGTGNGLNRFDGNSFTWLSEKDGLSNNGIISINEDMKGNLLIGSYSGVNIMEKNSTTGLMTITQLTEKEGLSGNAANALLVDKTNNLWIGTREGGISRLKMGSLKNKFGTITNLSEKQGLKNNNVTSISADDSGNMWFGTFDGLIQYIPGDNVTGQGIFYNYSGEEGLQFSGIKTSYFDSRGNLWLGTNGSGVIKYDGKTFTSFSSPQGLVDGDITSITEDEEANQWFATSGGVIRFDGHSFTKFNMKDGLLNNTTISLFRDKAGDMWFGTFGGGVVKYHLPEKSELIDGPSSANGYFTIYTDKEGLSNNTVISIHQDKNGIMWFGTMEGLNCFDGESFTYFTENEGLSNNSIMSIVGDDNVNLLIGTITGLDYLEILQSNKSDNERENGVHIDSFRIKKLGQVAGLKSTGFNFHSALIDNKSRVWMGTPKGLISFDENVSVFNSSPPKVHLTGLDIDGKFTDFRKLPSELIGKIKFDDLAQFTDCPTHLELPYNLNHLTFHYVGIDWSASENIKYSYKVEGLNDRWSEPSAEIKADYRNIRFGKYKFMVRAIGESSKWSDPFEFEFTIRPPIWFTLWAYILYALLLAFGIFVFDRFQRRRLIEKERQKSRDKELEQAHEIEKAYTELKATQAQLIQSEKMASLGELTAGIAHEIQNPLNFVNNFSEVSNELIHEMKEELVTGNLQLATELADDVIQNLEKINHHGKRAADIVKGMLQHSRTSSGVKEPTDINALADEYLRLAYHGLRAKDKSFNADFKTEFDESLPKINVIPQDIGRVLLNLINNAFYAVTAPPPPGGGIKNSQTDYKPTVIVRTSSFLSPTGGPMGASISVIDNGPGIPKEIIDKIFQPFFTTKPTGQGTGLGLSLSYDIVKAHGGELKVETKVARPDDPRLNDEIGQAVGQDEGTMFTIII